MRVKGLLFLSVMLVALSGCKPKASEESTIASVEETTEYSEEILKASFDEELYDSIQTVNNPNGHMSAIYGELNRRGISAPITMQEDSFYEASNGVGFTSTSMDGRNVYIETYDTGDNVLVSVTYDVPDEWRQNILTLLKETYGLGEDEVEIAKTYDGEVLVLSGDRIFRYFNGYLSEDLYDSREDGVVENAVQG